MGCIEIYFGRIEENTAICLIETWDVLKYCWTMEKLLRLLSLIETWDVLKYTMQNIAKMVSSV